MFNEEFSSMQRFYVPTWSIEELHDVFRGSWRISQEAFEEVGRVLRHLESPQGIFNAVRDRDEAILKLKPQELIGLFNLADNNEDTHKLMQLVPVPPKYDTAFTTILSKGASKKIGQKKDEALRFQKLF